LRIPLGQVVVNAMPSAELSAADVERVLGPLRVPTRAPPDPDLDATLRMAAGMRARRRTAEDMLARLKGNPGLPMVLLPRVPTADLGPEDVEHLAEFLR
jgi:hypothetical protein